MRLEFDPAKNEANRREHGMGLNDFLGFNLEPLVGIDDREDYGELRHVALGFCDGRLCSLVFTERGDAWRLISFRKATKNEAKAYERATSGR